MKSKTLILMAVAVVCGLAASYMTSRLLADRNEKVKILVAKKKLGPWTHVKNPEEMFELDERSKTDVPRNAVSRPESIKDFILMKALNPGEVLLQDNLMSKDKGGLDAVLPPGKRAVAVRTTQETVGGGFVLPGSHVDIIHTQRKGDKDPESRVILRNVLVRAVDMATVKPDDRPGVVPSTVTLEVTESEGLIIAKYMDVGKIMLSLRPFGEEDNKKDPAPEVKEEPEPKKEVAVAPKVDPPAPLPPPPPPVDKKTMLVMNGSQWVRATYVTRNGETQTTFEQSANDASSAAPPTVPPLPPPPPAPPAAAPAPVQGQPGAAAPRDLGGVPPVRQK